MSVEPLSRNECPAVAVGTSDLPEEADEPPNPGAGLATPPSPPIIPLADVAGPARRRDVRRARPGARTTLRQVLFPAASQREWNDWRWQSRHRITTLAGLERWLVLSPEERDALVRGGSLLPIGVTPYYLGLVSRADPADPLRRTIVPVAAELERRPGEADDPLGEEAHMAAPGVVHRYPDRVLFLVLDFCSTYCRYCTRSRVVGHGEITPSTSRLEAGLDYIRSHPEIRDVLLSGGDPLALSDDRLDWILTRLRQIPHVEFVRIGTKMPAVLPQRVTPALVRMLRRHHPLWMSLHFMHPDECTPEAYRACARLADAGIPLGAQIVLARGVNDDVEVMKHLVHHLLRMRVRPYYLYQCDPISGSAHFRTSVRKGLEIIAGLRGFTSGYAVPTYVVDAPGGGGKTPLQPDYVVGWEDGELILRNFEGRVFRYPDPDGAWPDASASPPIDSFPNRAIAAVPRGLLHVPGEHTT
ncbi:MAG: KamA family radical SAM protein [Acidobacteriota bacterium]|nr:KamA family radical SAM protein [Acidobacteriota bacterium]